MTEQHALPEFDAGTRPQPGDEGKRIRVQGGKEEGEIISFTDTNLVIVRFDGEAVDSRPQSPQNFILI